MQLIRRPVLCNYYVTYRCNAKCSFCDIWEKPSPYVTQADVRANLADLKRLGVKVIDFTGGEPLLHRELPDFLELAKSQGLLTTVTTNTLLYPKYAERLHGLVDMLHFSLDYPDAERHNASRGVTCHAHFEESLRVAKSLGERPDILYTVTEDSLSGIEEVYETYSKPNGLILILNPVFEYNAVGGGLSETALQQLLRWHGKRGVYLNKGFVRIRQRGGNNIRKPVCNAGTSTVVISPHNELVAPCYHLGEQHFPINGGLYELWHQPDVVAIRKQAGRLEACQGCAINCYLQPAFATQLNRYFFEALPSTLQYSAEKWLLHGKRVPLG